MEMAVEVMVGEVQVPVMEVYQVAEKEVVGLAAPQEEGKEVAAMVEVVTVKALR